MDFQTLGNKDLLKLKKTAFLASSTIPPDMVLKCYDWASGEHEGCVISGFSSKLEQDVLHFLLKSGCPVIMVLARQMYKVIPEELKEPLDQKRLLIISTNNAVRQSRQTAFGRNKFICEQADKILFTGITPMSSLFHLSIKYVSKTTQL